MSKTIPRLIEKVQMQSFMRLRTFHSFKKPIRKSCIEWKTIGAEHSFSDDFLYVCFRLDWFRLWIVVLAIYCGYALVFATITRCLLSSEWGHFEGSQFQTMSILEQSFWLSMGHLISIGYGHLQPVSRTAHVLVTAQFFLGILLSATLMGVVVTKASLPAVQIRFSEKCLITARNGVKHFMFRAANTRGNMLTQPDVRCSCFSHVETEEGESIWAAENLEIVAPPTLAPVFNFVHKIDESSPLWGLTDEQLSNRSYSLSLAATDNLTLQTLYASYFYAFGDVLFNVRFSDILERRDKNVRVIDFRQFNEVVPYHSRTKNDGHDAKSLANT